MGNDNADKLANLAIGVVECPYAKPKRLYLNVPYEDKDDAKKLGARWDRSKKKWFIDHDNKYKTQIVEHWGGS